MSLPGPRARNLRRYCLQGLPRVQAHVCTGMGFFLVGRGWGHKVLPWTSMNSTPEKNGRYKHPFRV